MSDLMDDFGAADIEALVQMGNALSVEILGTLCTIYRPADPEAPLAAAFGVVPIMFSSDPNFKSPRANSPGKPLCYGMFDRTLTLPGDYLVGSQGTFFIDSQDFTISTLLVECNRVVSIARAATPAPMKAGFGATARSGNGGAQRTNEPAFLAGWPASVLQGTKGEAGMAGLPDEVRSPWVAILLPSLPDGVTIQTGDQIETDLGLIYTVSSAELSGTGWRLTAAYGLT